MNAFTSGSAINRLYVYQPKEHRFTQADCPALQEEQVLEEEPAGESHGRTIEFTAGMQEIFVGSVEFFFFLQMGIDLGRVLWHVWCYQNTEFYEGCKYRCTTKK